jgi:hypothetical protein
VSELSRDRFRALADAYGGDVARWPTPEREAAARLMAAQPDFVRAVLASASRLDAALDDWRPQAASAQLREAIVAAATARARPRSRLFVWAARLATGAALAAACASGVMAGMLLSSSVRDSGDAAVAAAITGIDGVEDV